MVKKINEIQEKNLELLQIIDRQLKQNKKQMNTQNLVAIRSNDLPSVKIWMENGGDLTQVYKVRPLLQ